MPEVELGPVWLSLQLATVTVIVLLIVATPLAWWLAFTRNRARTFIEAVVAMPLVLPPTVLGFYLLVLLGPTGLVGGAWLRLTDTTLTFSFAGLVIGSVLYSFPFAVQPLQAAFQGVGRAPLEAAATLGAGPLDRFLHVASPLALRGYVTAVVLSFAHTLGESASCSWSAATFRARPRSSRSRSTSTSKPSTMPRLTFSPRDCSCSRSWSCCSCIHLLGACG